MCVRTIHAVLLCIRPKAYVYRVPSIKYVTLFLANFDPPSPCHTLSHIPRPPKIRHTSGTPDF